uniref:Uncharacterized protein n=1 Tax=Acanthochromis polyacanthus TaxID=80966 RepID=A0A3Q1F9P1_9TELE
MSTANYLLTEEQLLCCICLDVFINPVTLPCGHNFCKNCILQVETPGIASHDVPAESKRIPLKICLLVTFILTCLSFYFVANICFYQTVSSLKTLQLFEEDMDTKCTEHDRPLQLYCKNEQIPVCQSCVDSSHRFHHVVPLREEYEAKKAELEGKIHWKIQERRVKIQELKHSTKLSNEAANKEMKDGIQVFTTLIQSLEKAKTELIGMIDENQKTTKKQARTYIQDLDGEILELRRIRAKVEQISSSKNPLHLLQSFSYLNGAPLDKDWTDVSICPTMYEGLLRTAMVKAVAELTETVREEMKKLQDVEIKIQQAEITLDADTAHPALILSDDGKQVHCGEVWTKLPENPKRFDPAINVLGRQSFSCGRFHYDVQVKGKTGWTLGVAKASVNRKGEIKLNPENGYWTIHLRNRKEYFALASYPVPVSVISKPEKIRVFVDYEEGLVSFYDVDAALLLYSFTESSFTEKLYPFFSPVTRCRLLSGTKPVPSHKSVCHVDSPLSYLEFVCLPFGMF